MNASSPRRSKIKQALIVLFSGLVLSVGSCAGFLAKAGGQGLLGFLADLLAIGFIVGIVTVIATVIILIVEAAS